MTNRYDICDICCIFDLLLFLIVLFACGYYFVYSIIYKNITGIVCVLILIIFVVTVIYCSAIKDRIRLRNEEHNEIQNEEYNEIQNEEHNERLNNNKNGELEYFRKV